LDNDLSFVNNKIQLLTNNSHLGTNIRQSENNKKSNSPQKGRKTCGLALFCSASNSSRLLLIVDNSTATAEFVNRL
jgi:hypothetical protein